MHVHENAFERNRQLKIMMYLSFFHRALRSYCICSSSTVFESCISIAIKDWVIVSGLHAKVLLVGKAIPVAPGAA